MPYEPLHHKYRPQTFAELVGQNAIAMTLTYALRQQKIAPAYLFTGARGTGKTSSARILAKSLNCLESNVPTEKPCGKCEVCRSIANGSALDVIEIDAASNTGVDNIRELIERAQFAPVQCRYKVYVIDECHMLSSASFNALLKTLEEPPDRVVFVLATTDPQRVLPTIISRCQRFDFRRIELNAMVQHLGSIAVKESISINSEALQLVAQISQGGLRDAESLLDQLSLLEGEIVPDRVWDLVGAVPERELLALVQAIAADDGVGVLDRARHLIDRGREPLVVLQNLTSFYRDMLIAKTSPDRSDLVAITPPTWATLCEFVQSLELSLILFGQQHLRTCEIQVKNTTQPRLWLEVTLLGLLPSAIGNLSGQTTVPKISLPAVQPIAPTPKPAPTVPPAPAPQSNPVPPAVPVQPQETAPPNPTPREPAVPDAATNGNGKTHATNGSSNGTPLSQPADPAVAQPSIAPTQDFSELWEKILAQVQPFSTQIMLRQQCQLIHFNGQEARIGARSEKLFKMAKDRLPNIEDAFAKLYPQRIKVTLEVLTRNEAAAAATASPNPPLYPPPSQPPTPPAAPQVREEPRSPNSFKAGAGSSSGSPNIAPQAQSSPGPIIPAPVSIQPVEADLPAASVPPADDFIEPAAWIMEDEVTRAAKSLAQMFNGQIVSWEEGTEGEAALSSEALLQVGQAGLEALDSDPDGDVPF